MNIEVNFLTSFEFQIEILPRVCVSYGEELHEMGWDYAVNIDWLWFSLMIVLKK
jgi:hypothetical protein